MLPVFEVRSHGLRPHFRSFTSFMLVAACLLLVLPQSTAASSNPDEPESLAGLAVRRETGGVTLTWPSHPRERFVILCRPDVSVEAKWIELTNQMPAAAAAKQTMFYDAAPFSRPPAMLTNANLAGFYRVFVIPDFWFDMEGVELRGGPGCGEDFLPFYNGSEEIGSLFTPRVSLLVNGEEFSTETSTVDFGTEESVERINFGTRKKPRRAYARGLWFQHNTLANGEYTLQLKALLTLNLMVGDASQYLTLTNKPVRVRINNVISYPDWQPFIQGDTYTFAARSATRQMHWRVDVYDLKGKKVISKTGRTANGEIRWTWDLRDRQGRVRDDFDTDQSFRSTLTVWPMNEPVKGAQALLAKRKWETPSDWWVTRLGRDFVRKPPTAEERERRFITIKPHLHETAVAIRPLELFLHGPTAQAVTDPGR